MAFFEFKEKVLVDSEKLFSAVSKYEEYPEFLQGCRSVTVARKEPGRAIAEYVVSIMKEVSYTLEHAENKINKCIKWTLVESDFFTKNNGSVDIQEIGAGKSEVRFAVDVEFKMFIPGFILKGLVKKSIPHIIDAFESRVKNS